MPDVPTQTPDVPPPGKPPPPSRVGEAYSDEESVLALAEVDDPAAVAAALQEISPQDAAQMLSSLPPSRQAEVADLLEPGRIAEVVSHLDAAHAAQILDEMPVAEATRVVAEMSPDDRVDVLEELEDEKHDAIVAGLDAEEREEVRQLEQYPPDTAGGIMTTQVTALYEYLTIGDAIEQLRKLSEEFEQLFYTYVINRRGQLVGVLSMRDMILAKPDRRLRDIMIGDVRALPAAMDQEEVARLFRKFSYLAMPVVDKEDRLVGLVTVDDVVDVLEEEQTEDIHRLFGAGAEEKLSSPWHFSFRKRVWWLIVNLLTAFLAGSVVALFSGTIEAIPILAAFLPIVAGMGGNASAQAMAVAVRGLALSDVDNRLLRHVIKRELAVGLLTGLITGLLTGVAALLYAGTGDGNLSQAMTLGVLVCLALIINMGVACVSGAGIPFVMQRLGFDPAQSATIFATTVTDVVGFFALLGMTYFAAVGLGLL